MKPGLMLLAGLVSALCLVPPASAQSVAPIGKSRGAVVTLRGTPHLWISDDTGVLHWAGDTRALSGRFVDWGNTTPASLEQLRAAPRGEPWLSAGLLKLGDHIYFVKWEGGESSPTLLHVQSI